MASLFGQFPGNTYNFLTQIPGGISASLTTMQTGDGSNLPLQISSSTFNITGALNVAGISANKLLGTSSSANVITSITIGSGLSLSSGTLSSTLSSVLNVQRFTSGSGTYTPTAGMKYIEVEMVGGGGAGAGVANGGAYAIAMSGGGGGYIQFSMSAAQVGASLAYAVGAGGTAGTAGNNAGNDGANTTFGDWTAGKGQGGFTSTVAAGGSSTVFIESGSGGGTTTTGTGNLILAVRGSLGNGGVSSTAGFCIAPLGGQSAIGTQGRGVVLVSTTSQAAISDSTTVGGGGGGACSFNASGNLAGAVGTAGIIIVKEYL